MNALYLAPDILKRRPLFFLFLLFITVSLSGYSQFQPTPVNRSANRITISGKNYFLHEVQKGQTLYGISKEYQVQEAEIKKLNPELETRTVFHGMVLRIPDITEAAKSGSGKDDVKIIQHTVLAKETLFAIARQYGITVDELRDFNPDTKWGLKAGQVIRIPSDKISIAQPTLAKEVKTAAAEKEQIGEPEDTDHSKPCRTKPFPHENESFRMAILLPLNISQNDTLAYSDSLKPEHFRFYEFLEGIYLAIDSMRLEGLNLTVEVFDTERNPETIKGIIESGKIKEADLIIGPVFSNEIELVAPYAQARQIPLVSPFSTSDVATGNPYAFQVRNKLSRRIELATGYLGSRFSRNVIVIGRFAEKADPDFLSFTGNLGKSIREHDPAKKASFKTIYYSEIARNFVNIDGKEVKLDNYFSSSTSDYIILPSENEVFITEVVNELYQKSGTRKLQVFGMNQWVFSNLDPGNLYSINLESYSDFDDENPFVDFTDPAVLNFCRKYRENWNIEPSKYSFHGFDISYHFTRALFLFGRNITSAVPCWSEFLNHPAMLTPLSFQVAGNDDGYTNRAIPVIRYEKDELIRKKVN